MGGHRRDGNNVAKEILKYMQQSALRFRKDKVKREGRGRVSRERERERERESIKGEG